VSTENQYYQTQTQHTQVQWYGQQAPAQQVMVTQTTVQHVGGVIPRVCITGTFIKQ
jgi:hypothetical protein